VRYRSWFVKVQWHFKSQHISSKRIGYNVICNIKHCALFKKCTFQKLRFPKTLLIFYLNPLLVHIPSELVLHINPRAPSLPSLPSSIICVSNSVKHFLAKNPPKNSAAGEKKFQSSFYKKNLSTHAFIFYVSSSIIMFPSKWMIYSSLSVEKCENWSCGRGKEACYYWLRVPADRSYWCNRLENEWVSQVGVHCVVSWPEEVGTNASL
jgi:hypothetical protein